MIVFHELITEFDPKAENMHERIKNHVERFRQAISAIPNGQIMIIVLVGPYQTGKSSLISLLTHDADIAIGDGVNETTQGAYLYGPFDYNTMRAFFGLPPSQNMKIFFIDTEGICGYRIGTNPTLNQVLLTHILAPYVSLSQVTIVMHKAQIEVSCASFLNNFFGVVNQLIDGDSLTVLDVIPGQKFDRTLTPEQQYQQAVAVLQEAIPRRISNVNVAKFIPTSKYDEEALPLEQNQAFKERFNFAAYDIFQAIDEAQKVHQYDSQGIISQFECLLNNIANVYDLQSLAREARMQGELSTAERIYLPIVQQLMERKNNEIKSQFPDTSNSSLFSNEADLRMKTEIALTPILDSAYAELENYDMTPTIRERCLPKFQAMLEQSLTESFNALQTQYLSNMANMQVKYLLKKIQNKAETEFSQANLLINSDTQPIRNIKPIEDFDRNTREFTETLINSCRIPFALSEINVDLINEQVNELLFKCNETLLKNADSIMTANLQRADIQRKDQEQENSLSIMIKQTVADTAGDALKSAVKAFLVEPIQDWLKGGSNTPEPPRPKPPQQPIMGQKVDLKNVNLYSSSTSDKPARSNYSGTKYVQDGKVINGRVRITVADSVGKPAGKSTTGWVDVSSILSANNE